MRHHGAQALAQQALTQRARDLSFDHGAADVQQVVVVDTRWTGGLAIAAAQAAVGCNWVLALAGAPSSTCLIR